MKRFSFRLIPLLSLPVLLACFIIGGTSCKKDTLLASGGELRFSTDTLAFDTVFTSLGSYTQEIKIYNRQSQRVTLSSVRLAGGTASAFHLNVDGIEGNEVKNIDIAANDSVYVFATVKIDPTQEDNPFVITDQLIATLNGRDFSIPFTAYGQNAHYFKGPDPISASNLFLPVSGIWGDTDHKPYVLIGSVGISPGANLTIKEGTRIYMHANARMIVQGNLTADGTKKDSIIFQGDRLDRAYFGYEGYPGEWGGIYFDTLATGHFRHVILQNGGNGALGFVGAILQVNPTAHVALDRCIIRNSIGYGIFSYGGNLRADNTLIHDCGQQAVAIVLGGNDTFNNCTMALYGNKKLSHVDNPAAVVLNYYKPNETTTYTADLHAVFSNCVIYGTLEKDEVIVDNLSAAAFDVTFRDCVLKMTTAMPAVVQQTRVSYNTDPLFMDVTKWDYHAKAGSPLIDKGTAPSVSGLDISLDDVQRPQAGGWDIGAYEQ